MTSTNNIELQEKGLEAAARYLYRKGCDVLRKSTDEKSGKHYVIARDGMNVVVAEVHTRPNTGNGMPEETNRTALRRRLEKVALEFLADYDEVDLGVRLDTIDIVVIGEDRAMIRHAIGIANMNDERERDERVVAEQEDDE